MVLPTDRKIPSKPLQAIGQPRIALPVHHPFDGDANGFGWPHQDGQLLGTGESSVDQVAAEQQLVLQEQGKNHDRVLAALALVHRRRPRQSDFSEVGVIVVHRALGKLYHDLLLFHIDRYDGKAARREASACSV